MRSREIATCASGSFSIKPGATQLAVPPEDAISTAKARASASMPALAAADAGKLGSPRAKAWATKDDTPTRRPEAPAFTSHGLAAAASSKKAEVMGARLGPHAAARR